MMCTCALLLASSVVAILSGCPICLVASFPSSLSLCLKFTTIENRSQFTDFFTARSYLPINSISTLFAPGASALEEVLLSQ